MSTAQSNLITADYPSGNQSFDPSKVGSPIMKIADPITDLDIILPADQDVLANSGVTITRGLAGFRERLRRMYPNRRKLSNRAPLVAPPKWASSVNYRIGQVVENAAGTDWYICIATGSAPSAVEPSGRVQRAIPDTGTTGPAWMWLSKKLPLATLEDNVITTAVMVGGTGGVSSATLTISAVTSGLVAVGMTVTGTGVGVGVVITAFGTSTGGTGTVTLSTAQTITDGTTLTFTDGISVIYGQPTALPSCFQANRSIGAYGSGQDGTILAAKGGIYPGTPFGKFERLAQVIYNGSGVLSGLNLSTQSWDFYTDSNFIAFRGMEGRVFVNDHPVVLGNMGETGTNLYSGIYFGSTQRRKITLVDVGGLSNIYIATAATFFTPGRTAPQEFNGTWWGDSNAVGAGNMPTKGSYGLSNVVHQLLGYGEVGITASLGGSGVWHSNGSDITAPNYRTRLAQSRLGGLYQPTDPITHHFIQGSVNDGVAASNPSGSFLNYPTAAQLQSQTLGFLQDLRAASPNATLVFISVGWSEAITTNMNATNAAYKAGFDQFAATDSNCVYVDISDTGPNALAVINTRNSSSAPTSTTDSYIGMAGGYSSAFADGAHLSIHGARVMAHAIVNELYRKLELSLEV